MSESSLVRGLRNKLNVMLKSLDAMKYSRDDYQNSLRTAEANFDRALAELKAATETLERVNGRAQVGLENEIHWVQAMNAALRDIRAMCTKALTPRADGGGG